MPTRGEENNVRQMLDSFERTTADKNNIEVLFAIDEGKTAIRDFVERQNYSFNIHFFERPTTDNFSMDYYNWLADRSSGKNIWVFNDDAWMITRNWDKIILDKIKETKWSVYLVDTRDSTKSKPYNYFCTFPMVSRKVRDIVGYVLHPRVRVFPADKVIFDTMKSVNRIIDANDVHIQHNHIEEADPSKSRMMKIFGEDKKLWLQNPIDVRNDVIALLREAGEDFQKSKFRRILKILKEA